MDVIKCVQMFNQWPLNNADLSRTGQNPPLCPEQPEFFVAWIQHGAGNTS